MEYFVFIPNFGRFILFDFPVPSVFLSYFELEFPSHPRQVLTKSDDSDHLRWYMLFHQMDNFVLLCLHEFNTIMTITGIDFSAGPPVPTCEFPGGPASFLMRRSGGPVDFGDIYKV